MFLWGSAVSLCVHGMLDSRLRGVDWLTVIKPIPKAIETMLYKIFGSSEIEPWVKFMNNTLEPND